MISAINGSQEFLLLPPADQRNCFQQAYLFEVLPDIKPITTAAHREQHARRDALCQETSTAWLWAEEFNGTLD